MQVLQVLDIMEALIRASQYPDFVEIRRFGSDAEPGGNSSPGVAARYRNGSEARWWAAVHKPQQVQMGPDEVIDWARPTTRFHALTMQLLAAAQVPQFRSWESYSLPGLVWAAPCGIKITCQDGDVVYLRTIGSSGPGGSPAEPREDPFPDYTIPEGVRTCHQTADAPSATRS